MNIINQPVCKSREDETVITFLNEDEFTKEIRKAIENGLIWGVYYRGREIVAEDIWGEVHTNILFYP